MTGTRKAGRARTAKAKPAWFLALLALVMLLIGPGARAGQPTEQGPPPPPGLKVSSVTEIPETVRVLMPDNSVRTMYMDDYLKGVLPAEMGPDWPYDALCAQAVAARCYAATAHKYPNADVDTTTKTQIWQDKHYPKTDLAVDSTHKVAALYQGQVIEAFYFGHCDGHTRNSEDVGWGYVPYCRSVGCPCGNTTLYGHGVGMCQQGARVLALNGWDYKDILKHYYTGVEVRSTEPTALNWYFAEGSTRPDFVTYLCLGNPGDADAAVTVRYMVDGGGNRDVAYTLGAHSRLTIDAASDVGAGKDFSTEIDSADGVPVVAERPMYFRYHPTPSSVANRSDGNQGASKVSATQLGWSGGSDTVGSAYVRPTWYFAEGTTRTNFDTYLCIGNPTDTDAQVTISYMVEGGTDTDRQYVVGARSRKTIAVADEIGREKDFSCVVDSPNRVGLVVERPMYFNYLGAWSGGHDALGSLSARPSWYFAEGTTRADFNTYLCLANPNDAAAAVTVDYLISGGGNVEAAHSVAPRSRKTIEVSRDIGQGRDFSCRITSNDAVGIVAERPMYFNYHPTPSSAANRSDGNQGASKVSATQLGWTGGSDTVGTSYPKPSWFFAEGTTRPDFATYLSLANPSEKRAYVKITYLRGAGSTTRQDAVVEPLSRTTVSVNDFLGVADDAAHDTAIKVEVTNNVGIVAERPMYFDYGGAWTGGHDAMGY